MAQPKDFRLDIPASKIRDIKDRVACFPWRTFQTPADSDDWRYGPPSAYMQELCRFWLEEYDWTARQARMNSLPQWQATIDGYDIHFVYEQKSSLGRANSPVLLLHGWPYSFHSFHDLVPRLAHPERYGGDVEDAVDVIVPSIPGYTFSPPPSKPIGPREIARLFDILVTQVLGKRAYTAHGGDWGSYVAQILALDYPSHCIGIHLTMISVREHGGAPKSGNVPCNATAEERAFIADEMQRWIPESAYARLQSDKPLKLGYAMADSPIGVAAWIVEAFHAWSDLSSDKSFLELYRKEDLLDEIMLYLVTDAFHTSTWLYVGEFEEESNTLPSGTRVEVPVFVLALPDPVFPMVPKAVLEQTHNVVRYTEGGRGGHFPFYEVPEELARDLLEFIRLADP